MARSVCEVTVVGSVAELLAGVGSVTPPGSVTVAVLAIVPVAEADDRARDDVRGRPTGGSVTVVETLPVPEAGHDEPTLVEHVHVTPVSSAARCRTRWRR